MRLRKYKTELSEAQFSKSILQTTETYAVLYMPSRKCHKSKLSTKINYFTTNKPIYQFAQNLTHFSLTEHSVVNNDTDESDTEFYGCRQSLPEHCKLYEDDTTNSLPDQDKQTIKQQLSKKDKSANDTEPVDDRPLELDIEMTQVFCQSATVDQSWYL